MEVEFELTARDIRAFRSYHARESGAQTRAMVWGTVLGLLVSAFAIDELEASTDHPEIRVEWIPRFTWERGICVALGAGVTYCAFVFSRRRQHAEMTRGLFDRHGVILDPEGLRVINARSDMLVRWTAVRQFVVSRNYLFLYLTANTAIIVPCRAFPDDEAFKAFRRLARRHHKNAPAAHFPEAEKTSAESYHAKDDRIHDSGPS
jgi:hypothetical protein